MSIFVPGLLQGQTALITGGSSGINLGIAKRFAEHGANIAIVARNPERLAAAREEIGALNGGRVMACAADVRQFDALDAQVAAVAEQFGPIDLVVAGAAGNFSAPAATLSANAFAAVIGIDLLGTFHCWRAAHRHLRTPGARLLAISAPQAQYPMLMQSHACAAKAGVEQLVRTLAAEWGAQGITVNAISPGFVADTKGGTIMGEELAARSIAGLPVARWTTVDEMADLALFLASPAAAYMTGQILALDGGISVLGGGYFTQLFKG